MTAECMIAARFHSSAALSSVCGVQGVLCTAILYLSFHELCGVSLRTAGASTAAQMKRI